MHIKSWKAVTVIGIGVGAVTALEIVALLNGINGTYLSIAIAAIVAVVTGGAIKLWKK